MHIVHSSLLISQKLKNWLKCIEKFELFSTLDSSVENHEAIKPQHTANEHEHARYTLTCQK